MNFAYASKMWGRSLEADLSHMPLSLKAGEYAGVLYFGKRCDGPKIAAITIKIATDLLRRSNGGRGSNVAKLTRLDSDGYAQTCSVRAYDPEGNLIAIIGHDGNGFNIVG